MRKKTIIFIVIEILLIVYSCIACSKSRGLNIYLISYEMGQVFVYTYIPAILLATIFLFVVIRLVKKDVHMYKEQKVKIPSVSELLAKHEGTKNTEPLVNGETVATQKSIAKELVCTQCGAAITQAQKFCGKCGNKLG